MTELTELEGPAPQPKRTLAAGLYPGMTRAAYEQIDAINVSSLQHLERSPAHLREAMVGTHESTPALDFGDAWHAACLEPARFEQEYVRGLEGVGRRSDEDKQRWAEFRAHNATRTVVLASDYDVIVAMRDEMYANNTIAELLRGEGHNEVVAAWKDKPTGLSCKARIDRLVSVYGRSYVLDLKTTRDAAPWAFARDAARYRYYEQAAYYLDGAAALAPRERTFLHLVQEKARPYAAIVYCLTDDALEAGRRLYRRHLKQYAECRKTNTWPSYRAGIHPLVLPAWALREGAEEEEEE